MATSAKIYRRSEGRLPRDADLHSAADFLGAVRSAGLDLDVAGHSDALVGFRHSAPSGPDAASQPAVHFDSRPSIHLRGLPAVPKMWITHQVRRTARVETPSATRVASKTIVW